MDNILRNRIPFYVYVISSVLLTNSVWVSAKDLKSCIMRQYIPPSSLTAELADPSAKGSSQFQVVKYGKKPSLWRFSKPDIVTPTVKLPDFLAEYSRKEDYKHNAYHKFNTDKSALTAKVWLPLGSGPFPLVVITHGNSDPGFEYLAELLASRGFLVAQVDQTYLNGLWGENGARGWLLLEHLKLWRQWNTISNHLFYQKVDLSKIALVGMSRGGEAIALAAAFNQWQTLPGSHEPVDFGFNIRAVVALAPTDGQYLHSEGANVLKNTNYLVLQGGHDADVYQFLGSRQWQRTYFDDDADYLKQLIYFYRGNHINFNQSMSDNFHWWQRGNFDKNLLSPAQQEQLTKVFVSAFLEISLFNKHEYRQLFKQPVPQQFALPEDIYISRYATSNFDVIADFESGSGSVRLLRQGSDGTIVSLPLSIEPERLRGGVDLPNQVLKLSLEKGVETRLRIQLPSADSKKLHDGRQFNFQFSIARADAAEQQSCEPYNVLPETRLELLQGSLQRELSSLAHMGSISPLLLSDFSELKRAAARDARTEPVLQTLSIPIKLDKLADSADKNDSTMALDIIFKPTQNLSVILDDIGTTVDAQ